MSTREQVAREIRSARTAKGLSQAEVAKGIGASQAVLTYAENCRSISLSTLNAIRVFLDLEPLIEKPPGTRRRSREDDDIAAIIPPEDRATWRIPPRLEHEPSWSFPVKRKVDQNVDPVQGEFFTPEGLVDALVRESVQNSLDAHSASGSVHVRFGLFGNDHALAAERQNRYFGGLWEHLLAIPEAQLPRPDSNVEYLCIEDFGTVGLTGDVGQSSAFDQTQTKNNFFYFWRNVGRSEKSDTDRGRWGLGKTVFPAASKINTFFGLTIREGEGVPLLMGQSVLKIHKIADAEFTPYGGYGTVDADGFILPLSDVRVVRRFVTDFNLKRTSEPGLSVVLPFFRGEEIDLDDLIKSALQHYFYPVLSGALTLEFCDGTVTELLTSTTLEDVVDRYLDPSSLGDDPVQFKRLLTLGRWAITAPEAVELPRPSGNAPHWDRIILDHEVLSTVRERFESELPIHLRSTLGIRRQGMASATPATFSIFLEKDPTADRRQRHYIRRGISVINKDAMRTSGARGLVIIDDPLLSTVLGDAENPAHTEWNEKSTRAKEKYVYAPATIRFVKFAFDRAVDLLSAPPAGLIDDLISDVFSVAIAQPAGVTNAMERRPARGTARSIPPTIPAIPNLAAINVSRMSNGFSVRSTGKRQCVGQRITITVAYDTDGSDPFKKYERWDFELNKSPIRLDITGLTPERIAENVAEFRIEDENFEVTLQGFDSRRDLKLRAELVAGGDDE